MKHFLFILWAVTASQPLYASFPCDGLAAKAERELAELGRLQPGTEQELASRIASLQQEHHDISRAYFDAAARATRFQDFQDGRRMEIAQEQVKTTEAILSSLRDQGRGFLERWWNKESVRQREEQIAQLEADLRKWRKEVHDFYREWTIMKNDPAYTMSAREARNLEQTMRRLSDEIALLTGPIYHYRLEMLFRGHLNGTNTSPHTLWEFRDWDMWGATTGLQFRSYELLTNPNLRFKINLSRANENFIKNQEYTGEFEVKFAVDQNFGNPKIEMRFDQITAEQAETLRMSLNAMMAYKVFESNPRTKNELQQARGKLTDAVNEFGIQDPVGLFFRYENGGLTVKVDMDVMKSEYSWAMRHTGANVHYHRDLINELLVMGKMSVGRRNIR